MGKLILILFLIALTAAIVIGIPYGIYRFTKHIAEKSRRRELAIKAPELLGVQDLDPVIQRFLIEQKEKVAAQGQEITDFLSIATALLTMPDAYLLGEHLKPLQTWINNNQKEIK